MKKLQKTETKTLYASKEENEEMSKSKTLDGKVYVKTSPSGSPIRINFLSDLNDL